LARADGKLPAGFELVLISEESYTTFNPMLPEALAASVFPEQVVAPIRQMLKRTRIRDGTGERNRSGSQHRHGDDARG
jgi:NADH dehydrogenase